MSNDVQGIRKTENGSLLLRLSKAPAHGAQELQLAVKNALGDRAAVKRLTELSQLEIRDLDELTTKEEICEALNSKNTNIMLAPEDVKSIRKSFGGTQIATLCVAANKASSILELEKVRIGWVVCRIRSIFQPKRCFSCYMAPSWTLEEFSSLLNDLVEDVRDHSPAVIAGDFNSWALEWQSPVTNARGRVLLDAFATLDVELLNRGSTHTFSRGGMGSIIDLTFATSCLARSATWSVSEIYTASDHRAIVFNFGGRNSAHSNLPTRTHYKSATLDVDAFQLAIGNMSVSGNAEAMAQQAAQALQHACG
ncbi:hypothetical protein ACLKA6_017028, partial [Drosophila palustris]